MDVLDAISNVETITERKLNDEEREQLRKISFHWCSWSPTAPDHRNDSWVRYLRYAYPELKGLQPILDPLTWSDEIAVYPIGYVPIPPVLFLLATSRKFYVYNYQDDTMFFAGETLAGVLDGLMEERYIEQPMWEDIPRAANAMNEDSDAYFPVYDNVMHTSQEHELEHKVKEFTLEV